MEWKETASGHVNVANVIQIFVEERGDGNGIVNASIIGYPLKQRPKLFEGTLEECEAYRDDFIGKKNTTTKTARKSTKKETGGKPEPTFTPEQVKGTDEA